MNIGHDEVNSSIRRNQMGTRADFYIMRNNTLEWLGSMARDGNDIGEVGNQTTEANYISHLTALLNGRDDVFRDAFPWAWRDSRLTDYAYVFIEGTGVVFRVGDNYPLDYQPDDGIAGYYISKSRFDERAADFVGVDNDDPERCRDAEIPNLTYHYPDMGLRG
jgi:hypothetical protein